MMSNEFGWSNLKKARVIREFLSQSQHKSKANLPSPINIVRAHFCRTMVIRPNPQGKCRPALIFFGYRDNFTATI